MVHNTSGFAEKGLSIRDCHPLPPEGGGDAAAAEPSAGQVAANWAAFRGLIESGRLG